MRVLVIDEADFFFCRKEDSDALRQMDKDIFKPLPQKIQYILFSATYTEDVQKEIKEVVPEAQLICLKKEKLQLDHI